MIDVRAFGKKDLPDLIRIWNAVVANGTAFPQTELLDEKTGKAFFEAQTHCGVAEKDGKVCGLYILHPNNVGRCAHICNASYAVDECSRSMGVGEALVRDCIKTAPNYQFRVLQFNAVVSTNAAARHLYEKLGFTQLGTIKGGFLMPNGSFEDICPYYISL